MKKGADVCCRVIFLISVKGIKKPQTPTNSAILTKGPMELLMQETHLVPKATTPLWEGRGRESLSLIGIWRWYPVSHEAAPCWYSQYKLDCLNIHFKLNAAIAANLGSKATQSRGLQINPQTNQKNNQPCKILRKHLSKWFQSSDPVHSQRM